MTKLALQIPTKYLKELSLFTDFDFALAHKVLEDEVYREFYCNQALRKRQVWLDNSMLELGEPLPEKDIIKAASMIRATHIIAPDKFDNPTWSMEQAIHFKVRYGAYYHIVGGCHGDPTCQQNIVGVYLNRDILPALSYREDRSWYASEQGCPWPIHFFGFGNLQDILKAKPSSVDTDFPIRLGMQKMPLTVTDRNDKTHLPPIDFDVEFDLDQLHQIVWNCFTLKVALSK